MARGMVNPKTHKKRPKKRKKRNRIDKDTIFVSWNAKTHAFILHKKS